MLTEMLFLCPCRNLFDIIFLFSKKRGGEEGREIAVWWYVYGTEFRLRRTRQRQIGGTLEDSERRRPSRTPLKFTLRFFVTGGGIWVSIKFKKKRQPKTSESSPF